MMVKGHRGSASFISQGSVDASGSLFCAFLGALVILIEEDFSFPCAEAPVHRLVNKVDPPSPFITRHERTIAELLPGHSFGRAQSRQCLAPWFASVIVCTGPASSLLGFASASFSGHGRPLSLGHRRRLRQTVKAATDLLHAISVSPKACLTGIGGLAASARLIHFSCRRRNPVEGRKPSHTCGTAFPSCRTLVSSTLL
nr:hypothetical protein CFP56_63092 [Quercus suber]